MPLTILVTAPTLHASGVAVLAESGCRVLYTSLDGGVGELSAKLASEPVDGVISRTLPITSTMIDLCPSLRVISRHGAGYNNVDVEAASRRGIPVLIAGGANARSVAELAVGLMLCVARSIPLHDSRIRGAVWDRATAGVQLSGKTLGLVAFGTIGRMVREIAEGIGMRVQIYDPFLGEEAGVARVSDLETLLSTSDVVSLHCPLTPDTRRMIDAAALRRMKRGAILVNTARGGLVDEAALAEAVASEHLAGAGLDTFEDEPLPSDHPFNKLPGIVMTPHMGGSTDVALSSTASTAARHALAILRGERLPGGVVVNSQILQEHA